MVSIKDCTVDVMHLITLGILIDFAYNGLLGLGWIVAGYMAGSVVGSWWVPGYMAGSAVGRWWVAGLEGGGLLDMVGVLLAWLELEC